MLRTTLFPLACAAALVAALPPPAVAQTTSAPAEDNEALHNIQSNFAHMAPPPRSVESINNDLQQAKAAPVDGANASSSNSSRTTPAPTPNRRRKTCLHRQPIRSLLPRRQQPRKKTGRAAGHSSLRWHLMHARGVP